MKRWIREGWWEGAQGCPILSRAHSSNILVCSPTWKLSEHCPFRIYCCSVLSHVWLLSTPSTATHQASLSFTVSWRLLKRMSIELVMLSNHLVLCHPLLFLPSVFPSIRVFSNELALHIRWSKYWSFSFSISSSNEYSGLISFRKVNYSEKKQNSRSTSFPSPGSFSLSLLGAGAK